jgi:hypothetical protein
MEEIMEQMIGKMKPEEKERMMERMMEKFFADMTEEEKQKIMEKMMSKIMMGMDMSKMMPQMMVKMMGGKEMPMMKMMQEMRGKMGEGDFKPWEMCEKMEKALQEIAKTNKEILEELKKR